MKNELDDLLCQRYPKIFAERHNPKRETPMCWGFTCGDGWFLLIDTLCGRLQLLTDQNLAPQVVAQQVKEKLGELRFYVRNANDYQRGTIDFATTMSTHICEQCGRPGRLLNDHGYLTTCCPEHAPASATFCTEE